MKFIPGNLGVYSNPEVAELARRVGEELLRLANDPQVDSFSFTVLNNEPERVWDGLTVFADGTNWNPGAGRGVYTYYSSAWNKLG